VKSPSARLLIKQSSKRQMPPSRRDRKGPEEREECKRKRERRVRLVSTNIKIYNIID
jgi:hypothetical protein